MKIFYENFTNFYIYENFTFSLIPIGILNLLSTQIKEDDISYVITE